MNSYTITFPVENKYRKTDEYQMCAKTLLEARTIARNMSRQHTYALITDRTVAVESYINGKQTSSSF